MTAEHYPVCKVDIRQEENGLFSVKLDDKEISQSIVGLSFSVQGGGFPILTLQVVAEGFNLSSRALLNIPEPYGSYIQFRHEKAHSELECATKCAICQRTV